MIEVVLNDLCACKLHRELRDAGAKEIGGVLAAEQVSDGRFVVLDLSVQRNGGPAHFDREPEQHRAFMRRFHRKHGNQPGRFNYLGEWHTHPSFVALPSAPDVLQMQRLVEDREQVAPFLVLLVLRLGGDAQLVGSAHAFRRGHLPIRVRLAGVGATINEERTAFEFPDACCASNSFL